MAVLLSLTRVLVALYLICNVVAVPTFDSYVNSFGSAGNLTIAVNVPKDRPDDLYFSFSAPSSWQWAAFGFGSQMRGSLMFIIYPSADGKNVTVSARSASGYSLPSRLQDVEIEKLNGTGLQNGNRYVVNARCSKCRKYSGGSVDVTNTAHPMIWAYGTQTDKITSNDVDFRIQKHSNKGSFTLDLKKATGEAGVPVLTAATTPAPNPNPNSNPNPNTDGDDGGHEFPIMVHALLLIGCFLVVLPAGYLFLRVFNRVWLHAGIQSLGLVVLIAGVVAGIVYNVDSKREISYHQILGIITTVLVLSAFTLGAISHAYFKKRKVSSPLLKFHRMAGPASILFGNGTAISGFYFRGEPRRILPYTVALLAVIILVGAVGFLMKKRAVRKAALVTPAAQNFNAGYYAAGAAAPPPAPPAYGNVNVGMNQGYYAPHGQRGDNVPMQTFNRPFGQQNHGYAQQVRGYKAPDTMVRPVGHI